MHHVKPCAYAKETECTTYYSLVAGVTYHKNAMNSTMHQKLARGTESLHARAVVFSVTYSAAMLYIGY